MKRHLVKPLIAAALGVAAPLAGAASASAQAPDAWQKKTSVCTDSLSYYGQNPAYNSNAPVSHVLAGHKRLYFTTGPVEKGWMPVYSAGQEEWHTGWVRQECLADGWGGYPDDGSVVY